MLRDEISLWEMLTRDTLVEIFIAKYEAALKRDGAQSDHDSPRRESCISATLGVLNPV